MSAEVKEPTGRLILGAGAVLAAPLFVGATLAGAVGSAGSAPAPTAVATVRADGLSLTPSIVQLRTKAGAAAAVTVANTAEHAVRVTLRVRPWLQAPDGTVAPDPHRSLAPLVHVNPSTVTLGAGRRRTIHLTLPRRPAGGSLFAALDLTGAPRGVRLINGIAPRYRLIGSLRLNPARVRTRLRAGALHVTNDGGRRTIAIAVRNLGNTVEPISGRVVIEGPDGTRRNALEPVPVVPRRQIRMTLGTIRDPRRGPYRLSVTLQQFGRTVLHVTRTLRVT